ncbi:MAG: RtcB family protein [Saprospiraceae bacterium]|nr:RtcB family protein [Saprospiraceae bacterium]
MAHKLRSKDFHTIDIYNNQTISIALSILKKHYKYNTNEEKIKLIQKVKDNPQDYLEDPILNKIAFEFYEEEETEETEIVIKDREVELNVFGRPLIKANAYQQMRTATQLPVVEKAALMPDSHLGYGIPIGGVLGVKDAVIPYAIGMDIGCRMSLTLYDVTERYFNKHVHKFKQSIIDNTAFGLSKVIPYKQEHQVIDRPEFNELSLLKSMKSKAARQLGSSGSGNHFVEWGLVHLEEDEAVGLTAGTYVGLLAHSGSRGFGASIARFYADLAKEKSLLPSNMRHLSWLDMDSDDGKEYWMAMNLAGDYAKACHDRIHINVAKSVGLTPLCKIENHHNFAWKERVDGHELIVHRKGSTPAGENVLGIIPGSMTDPGFIVKGLGNSASMASASHGAGRKYSRKETISKNTNSEMRKHLRQHRINLIGGALDESPFAYKNLEQVMDFQKELVQPIGKFFPRIVRMDKAR